MLWTRVHQLYDDGLVAFRDVVAHFVCGEFPTHQLRKFEQICQILLVPDPGDLPLHGQLFYLLARIVDQRAELCLLLICHALAETVVHLLLDDARTVVEDVKERVVCAVQIAHKVLRPLRQHQLGLQVDDLLVDNLLRRILFRHQPEHFILFRCHRYRHIASSCEIFSLFCILTSKQFYFKSIRLLHAEILRPPHAVPCPHSQQRNSSPPSPRH